MIQFRRIKASEIEQGIKIAENAFQEDLFFQAITGRREKSYHLLMEMLMKVWLKNQIAFIAEKDGKAVGIALLASDALAAVKVSDCIKAGVGGVILSCGIRNIISFLHASSCFNEDFQRVSAPKYYLTLLAVAPSAQGQGIGTAMLRECIIPFFKNQNSGTLCLNTNTERNRKFYLKNHFEEIGETAMQINGSCVPNWSYKMELSEYLH